MMFDGKLFVAFTTNMFAIYNLTNFNYLTHFNIPNNNPTDAVRLAKDTIAIGAADGSVHLLTTNKTAIENKNYKYEFLEPENGIGYGGF